MTVGSNPNIAQNTQPPKLGKAHLRPPAEAARELQAKKAVTKTEMTMNPVDVTSISIYSEEMASPGKLNFFGYKIDLSAKVEGFKEQYRKNYALTKSPNLMVKLFAAAKAAFYGSMLSLLGCKPQELKELRATAIADAIHQNKILFKENEYNGELLAIVGGGSKKQVRQQQRIIGEIRKQLITQAKNLGLKDHYTQARIMEIQLEQCQEILSKFKEEKSNLEYQLAYLGTDQEVEIKLQRLDGFVKRAEHRLVSQQKKLARLLEKNKDKINRSIKERITV